MRPKLRNKSNQVVDLKNHHQRSHNPRTEDERIIALVRFLARRAAEEDYRKFVDAPQSPDKNKGGT